MYELVKYVHILCAVIWVGGAFYAQLLAIRATRSQDVNELPALGSHFEFIGTRIFLPASILLFLAGAVMVVQRWSFEQTWISVAIVLWLLSALVGSIYLGPNAKRVGQQFREDGPSSARARALLSRLFLISRLELLSFAVIIALMVGKPTIA